ncbi:MAG: Holliday junction resolvase RuvX [candidate division Zixibacteria bacterium]|nr:Holliday junction resolvase RuvX [candidate division Zixibacteria bacterium]
MARILAIDFGERRIGLAVSDPLRITAQGLPTIDAKKTKDLFSHIQEIIKDKKVTKIVVGMPKNMDGSIGSEGEQVQKFIQKLAQKTGVEVTSWDERLTSVQSQKSMREMGIKQKQKEAVDRISATLILQSYLDSLNKEN